MNAANEAKALTMLRQNGRAKITDISRATGTPVSSTFEWLKGAGKEKLGRFTCLPNYAALDYNSRAFITLKCDKQQKPQLQQRLANSPLVNSLWKINNGYDYLLDVITRSMGELENFLEVLEGKYTLKSKDVYFIIEEVKTEAWTPQP